MNDTIVAEIGTKTNANVKLRLFLLKNQDRVRTKAMIL